MLSRLAKVYELQLRDNAGTVHVGSKRISGLSPSRVANAGVARTFQTVHLVPGRTVLENVAVSTLSSKRGGLVSGVFDTGMPAALEKAAPPVDRRASRCGTER